MKDASSRIPEAVIALAAIAMALIGPIHQLAHYHAFADARALAGIPNALDVVSNAGFALVALWGLWRLREARVRSALGAALPGYALFVVAIALTAAGSTWYHLAPDDARLVWDRIPIALACAGLIAGVHADTHPVRQPALAAATLALVAVLSVLWWSFTARLGSDDLRPYLLLQGAPLVLVPLWQAHARRPRGERIAFAGAVALYAAAKAAELADRAVLHATGLFSGHTLKHVLATAAAALLLGCIMTRAQAAPIDFSSSAGFEATCTPLAARAPQAVRRDDERVAWAICTAVASARDGFARRDVAAGAFGNAAAMASLRLQLEGHLATITRVRSVLEGVRGNGPYFIVEPGKWEIDWDGDGRISAFERHFLWVPRRDAPATPWQGPQDEAFYRARYASPVIRVDKSDVHWAIAYCDFAEAALNLVLAYDLDARNGQLALAKPARVRDVAYRRLLAGVRESRKLRESLLAETDDDREWIPNPAQKDTSFPLALDAQAFATWGTLLGHVEQLLQGKTVLAGRVEGARGGMASDLAFGLCAPGSGIDVRSLFLRPLQRPLDGQELAARCVPVTKARPVSGLAALASDSMRRNEIGRLSGVMSAEGTLLRHLYWVN